MLALRITFVVVVALVAPFGCNNTVTVIGDEENQSNHTSEECVPCTDLGISHHYAYGSPFCPGEQEKYDALLACGCQESTCAATEDGCSHPADNSDYLCQGGLIGGACERCLPEKCPDEWRACCPWGVEVCRI
jgi:hypothetical protein